MVEFDDTLLVAIGVLDDALAEVPGITLVEEALEVSACGVAGEFSELVFNCLALSEAEHGSECDFAERGHFVVESLCLIFFYNFDAGRSCFYTG